MRYHALVIARLLCLLAIGTLAAGADQAAARAAIERLEKLLPGAPDRGEVLELIAVNHVLLGEKEPALSRLREVARLLPDFDPTGDRDLAVLAAEPGFRRLVEGVQKGYRPVVHSKIAFRVSEEDLVPEGIAWDPIGKTLYVGSIHKQKIIQVPANGPARDFVPSGQDGLGRVLGMKVHAESRTLWALANTDSENGVFCFDIRTGKLVRKYTLSGKPDEHLFNDLVVSRSADVYLTDTHAHRLYWISHESGELREFGVELPYANGIAMTPDEKTLFVAHFNGGLSAVDIASRKTRVLPRPAAASAAGIDGLYFYRDSLVAVQNGFGTPRLRRYFLDPALARIERVETLEYRNPLVAVPTTAAVAGDTLFFMANTCLDRYRDGKLPPGEKLGPLLILKRKL